MIFGRGAERARAKVVAALLDGAGRRYGYEMCRAAHVRPGQLYRVLDELLADGYLTDGWVESPWPRRRYYELTEHGRQALDLGQGRMRHERTHPDP